MLARIANRKAVKKYRDSHKKEQAEYAKCYRKNNRKKLLKYLRKYNKAYRLKNRKRLNKQIKEWNQKNFKYKQEYSKNYYQLNKETIKKRTNKYTKNRRKIDSAFRIVTNYRTRISEILQGKPKYNTTLNLVGCSIKKLRKHLESQFKDGMSWDNYGYYGWHVDHIKPLASFDLSKRSEQIEAFRYTNLQPLWWYDNLSKGKRV